MATYPVSKLNIGDGNTYELHGSAVDTQARADIANLNLEVDAIGTTILLATVSASSTGNIVLSQSIDNFKFILFIGVGASGSSSAYDTSIYPVSIIKSATASPNIIRAPFQGAGEIANCFYGHYVDSTHLYKDSASQGSCKIFGIK